MQSILFSHFILHVIEIYVVYHNVGSAINKFQSSYTQPTDTFIRLSTNIIKYSEYTDEDWNVQ